MRFSPAPNATVMQPFSITGWAIHGPGSGTGIDAVHIYGCTTSCTFWGAATDGVARPDVAAVYGAQYLNSGYTLVLRCAHDPRGRARGPAPTMSV